MATIRRMDQAAGSDLALVDEPLPVNSVRMIAAKLTVALATGNALSGLVDKALRFDCVRPIRTLPLFNDR